MPVLFMLLHDGTCYVYILLILGHAFTVFDSLMKTMTCTGQHMAGNCEQKALGLIPRYRCSLSSIVFNSPMATGTAICLPYV